MIWCGACAADWCVLVREIWMGIVGSGAWCGCYHRSVLVLWCGEGLSCGCRVWRVRMAAGVGAWCRMGLFLRLMRYGLWLCGWLGLLVEFFDGLAWRIQLGVQFACAESIIVGEVGGWRLVDDSRT